MADQISTPSAREDQKKTSSDAADPQRRDFLVLTASAMGVVGAAAFAWPLVDSMNPARDVLALAKIEVDLSNIESGQAITAQWQGKPVFIRHRTQAEIDEARSTDLDDLPDPQADTERVIEPQWLVMIGICTHLGCVPLGQKSGDNRGDYGGWFCPCHGSHYDQSGRIRKGPAPNNLEIPPYRFISESVVEIG